MDKKIRIACIPLRRSSFPAAPAIEQKAILAEAIKDYDVEWVWIDEIVPDGIACRLEEAAPIINKMKMADISGLFFPHMDFGTEFLAGKIAAAFDLPVLVWGNSDGEIKNNMLQRYTQCGIFATGKILNDYHRKFDYIVSCGPDSIRFKRGIDNFIRVCSIIGTFRNMRIMQVATRPEPFWSVKYNEQEILERFGIEVLPVTLSQVVRDVKSKIANHPDDLAEKIAETGKRLNACSVAKDQMDNVMALTMVLEDYFNDFGLSAMAMQCWSDLQDELGIMPCSTFGLMCDQLKPVACETDVKGAIGAAMLQAAGLNQTPIFFSDVTIPHPTNPNANLLWHCGCFPSTLAKEGQNLCMANHPLQAPYPGAVGEWELKNGDITINRFDCQDGKYSMMMSQGRATEGPKVNGTYVWYEVDNWAKWEHRLVTGPYIHHISGTYGKMMPSLYSACKYIEGLEPDPLSPGSDAVDSYLWGLD